MELLGDKRAEMESEGTLAQGKSHSAQLMERLMLLEKMLEEALMLCSACGRALPASSFSDSQHMRGRDRCCYGCRSSATGEGQGPGQGVPPRLASAVVGAPQPCLVPEPSGMRAWGATCSFPASDGKNGCGPSCCEFCPALATLIDHKVGEKLDGIDKLMMHKFAVLEEKLTKALSSQAPAESLLCSICRLKLCPDSFPALEKTRGERRRCKACLPMEEDAESKEQVAADATELTRLIREAMTVSREGLSADSMVQEASPGSLTCFACMQPQPLSNFSSPERVKGCVIHHCKNCMMSENQWTSWGSIGFLAVGEVQGAASMVSSQEHQEIDQAAVPSCSTCRRSLGIEASSHKCTDCTAAGAELALFAEGGSSDASGLVLISCSTCHQILDADSFAADQLLEGEARRCMGCMAAEKELAAEAEAQAQEVMAEQGNQGLKLASQNLEATALSPQILDGLPQEHHSLWLGTRQQPDEGGAELYPDPLAGLSGWDLPDLERISVSNTLHHAISGIRGADTSDQSPACSGCQGLLPPERFSGAQHGHRKNHLCLGCEGMDNAPSAVPSIRDQEPRRDLGALVMLTCAACRVILLPEDFSTSQRLKGIERRCNLCVEAGQEQRRRMLDAGLLDEVSGRPLASEGLLRCSACSLLLRPIDFSVSQQLKDENKRRCKLCVKAGQVQRRRMEELAEKGELLLPCYACWRLLPPSSFSPAQHAKKQYRRCGECVAAGQEELRRMREEEEAAMELAGKAVESCDSMPEKGQNGDNELVFCTSCEKFLPCLSFKMATPEVKGAGARTDVVEDDEEPRCADCIKDEKRRAAEKAAAAAEANQREEKDGAKEAQAEPLLPCSACGDDVRRSGFSKGQRGKGRLRRCVRCVEANVWPAEQPNANADKAPSASAPMCFIPCEWMVPPPRMFVTEEVMTGAVGCGAVELGLNSELPPGIKPEACISTGAWLNREAEALASYLAFCSTCGFSKPLPSSHFIASQLPKPQGEHCCTDSLAVWAPEVERALESAEKLLIGCVVRVKETCTSNPASTSAATGIVLSFDKETLCLEVQMELEGSKESTVLLFPPEDLELLVDDRANPGKTFVALMGPYEGELPEEQDSEN